MCAKSISANKGFSLDAAALSLVEQENRRIPTCSLPPGTPQTPCGLRIELVCGANRIRRCETEVMAVVSFAELFAGWLRLPPRCGRQIHAAMAVEIGWL